LVGNAIKFTRDGEVALRVRTSGSGEGRPMLHFVVSDTGIGIPAEKLKSIFESFSQADTSTTREYGGTGLGLTISRRLVRMMGGHIWAESETGKGSQFHFSVELERGEAPERTMEMALPARDGLAGARVLVVDDNRTNRRILEGLLSNWGMKPVLASDGEMALAALLAAHQKGETYQLILTDMHMPSMDGFELIERIRDEHSAATATIMMLTSGGHRGDAARCDKLGVAAYLLKPIRQAELREAILRVLGTVAEHRRAPMVTKEAFEGSRDQNTVLDVLLAEDNEVNWKLAKRVLEKRGHRVTVVVNGRDALEALKKARYDVTLMDVQMPEMDGLQATSELRAWEEVVGGRQPVVAMTALVMKGDKERCLAAGMDGYLTKPLRPQEMDEVLEKYVAKKKQRAEMSGLDNAKISQPVEPAGGFEQPQSENQEAVDTKDLLERFDDDRDFLAELTGIFREEYPMQLRMIEAGLQARNAEEVERGAHSLKGALSNLAAWHAVRLAADLENAGISGDLTGAAEGLRILQGELERVFEALRLVCRQTAQ
jgi:two-component system, sensor histidine kinase and response regulator